MKALFFALLTAQSLFSASVAFGQTPNLLGDELRDTEADVRDRIRVLEGELAQIKIDAQRAQDELRGAEEAFRRADEAFGSAATPEEKARQAWRRSLARLQGRAAAAAAGAVELSTRFRNDELAARRAEHEHERNDAMISGRMISCPEWRRRR